MLERLKGFGLFCENKLPSKIDLHSHLIPEIDDGCDSLETSLKIIRKMKKLGYKKLITTPHIMYHRYPNNIEIIKQGLFELRSILKVENIEIELEAAAEYYVDEHFLDLIKKNELLSFAGKYILFEMPYTTRPKILEQVIEEIKKKNFIPVLAHPERYRFIKDVLEYRNLKKLGVYFQVNINSLGGFYGKEALKKSLILSKKGMVDFVGSDIHHQKHMQSYEENIFSNNIEILFRNNKILNDNI